MPADLAHAYAALTQLLGVLDQVVDIYVIVAETIGLPRSDDLRRIEVVDHPGQLRLLQDSVDWAR